MLVDLESEMKILGKLGIPSHLCEKVITSRNFLNIRGMINAKEVHTLQLGRDVYFFSGDSYTKF